MHKINHFVAYLVLYEIAQSHRFVNHYLLGYENLYIVTHSRTTNGILSHVGIIVRGFRNDKSGVRGRERDKGYWSLSAAARWRHLSRATRSRKTRHVLHSYGNKEKKKIIYATHHFADIQDALAHFHHTGHGSRLGDGIVRASVCNET